MLAGLLSWFFSAIFWPGCRLRQGKRSRLGWPFAQNFPDESRRHGRGQNGAVAGTFDFQAVEEYTDIGVSALRADRALGGVKETEERAHLIGDGLRIGFIAGKSFCLQMQGSEVASRDHGDRRLRKQQA